MERGASMTIIELTSMVHSILAGGLLAIGENLTFDTNLLESGLDSMAVAQLLLEIEARTGVWLDESLLTPENLTSCKTLARCVYGALEA